MKQYWLIVGSEKNWKIAFENNNIWGLKDFRELRSLWNMLRDGDGLIFYVSKPVHGIVGFGNVRTKFKQTNPLWPDEIKKKEVIWPLRFEFDIEHCLSPALWKTGKYTSPDLLLITRMVFQCYPIEEVNAARQALSLPPLFKTTDSIFDATGGSNEPSKTNHDEAQSYLTEIGRIQGYVADKEYPLESSYLDVVWRRVERSVPTYVFEIQVSGNVYQAMAKLKHAYDIWNSNIFLVSDASQMAKYQELLSGTFHEVKDKMRFIDIAFVKELLNKKTNYLEMERSFGIFKK